MSSRVFLERDFQQFWNLLESLLVYPNTVLLSVQKNSFIGSSSNSFRNMQLILDETSAAVSSGLGIVVGFRGVTRDFPMMRTVDTVLDINQSKVGTLSITILTSI